MRVLIVEDETGLSAQIAHRLDREGFACDRTGDGSEGLYLAQELPFDALVLDLGLPGTPGLEVLRRLRATGNPIPILVLTARSRWQEKVEGLEAGADDYLAKPFEMDELIARLRALLRRAQGSASREIRVGPLALDPDRQQVRLADRPIELTAYEYRLLEHLVTQRGRVLSKIELADHLYPYDQDRDSNTIEVLLGRLRRKLDPDGTLAPIETLRGRGYRLRLADDADRDSS